MCLPPTEGYSFKILHYINNIILLLFVEILENDSVCSMSFSSNNINLIGREDESAMVIRNSRYFQHWTGKNEFNCRFTVTSSLGLGIFAVIQRLSFRRNAQGQCIDYVQVYLYFFNNLYILLYFLNCL